MPPERLKPGKLSDFLAVVPGDNIAAVGHMPEIGAYAEWLLGATEESIPMAKAAAACIDFKNDPAKFAAEVKGPLLVVSGSTDIQVSAADAKRCSGFRAMHRPMIATSEAGTSGRFRGGTSASSTVDRRMSRASGLASHMSRSAASSRRSEIWRSAQGLDSSKNFRTSGSAT